MTEQTTAPWVAIFGCFGGPGTAIMSVELNRKRGILFGIRQGDDMGELRPVRSR